MEQLTTLDIQKKVKEVLQNDPVLAAYVKKLEIGNKQASRKLFPFVTVAEVTDNVQPLCIGNNSPDLHNYSIIIQAGTHHTLPEIACEGNGPDKKGIGQLVDDIVAALYPVNLSGAVNGTLHLVRTTIAEAESEGGRSMSGAVIFRGIRKQ